MHPVHVLGILCRHLDQPLQQRGLLKLPKWRAAASASRLCQRSCRRVEVQGGGGAPTLHGLLQELQVCGCKASIRLTARLDSNRSRAAGATRLEGPSHGRRRWPAGEPCSRNASAAVRLPGNRVEQLLCRLVRSRHGPGRRNL